MGFLIAGVVLLVLYLAGVSPVSAWHWGWIALPFGLAVLWWVISDRIGLTQRRAVDKMEARKVARRQRDMEALGLDVRREKRITVLRDANRPAQTGKDKSPPKDP
jgi:small Trp-rich protein